MNIKIPKAKFYEPELNLPGRYPNDITEEARFTLEFAKSYSINHSFVHHKTIKKEIACVRHVAINGFGIADLVSISWTPFMNKTGLSIEEFLMNYKPTIRAFEVKLVNWRKGMTQAHRYKYFADAAILVIPYERIVNALEYLETFKKIHIGIWGFDNKSMRIIPIFTPRPNSPREIIYKKRVLEIISNTSKDLPFLRMT